MYGPLCLVLLPFVWIALIVTGFTLMMWAFGVEPLRQAFILSGSSIFTLGFAAPESLPVDVLVFLEAFLGLGLVALVISYLPSIYGAFARREQLVGLLEARAGTPPSAVEMLTRYQRVDALAFIDSDLFPRWEQWFSDVEESHTSFAALVFFRSPQPERSWIVAAGCVLDTAVAAELRPSIGPARARRRCASARASSASAGSLTTSASATTPILDPTVRSRSRRTSSTPCARS